jgi:hypothetical protein
MKVRLSGDQWSNFPYTASSSSFAPVERAFWSDSLWNVNLTKIYWTVGKISDGFGRPVEGARVTCGQPDRSDSYPDPDLDYDYESWGFSLLSDDEGLIQVYAHSVGWKKCKASMGKGKDFVEMELPDLDYNGGVPRETQLFSRVGG